MGSRLVGKEPGKSVRGLVPRLKRPGLALLQNSYTGELDTLSP